LAAQAVAPLSLVGAGPFFATVLAMTLAEQPTGGLPRLRQPEELKLNAARQTAGRRK
jgi:hypothetical protein